MTKILLAYASKHGSTREVAEAIAETLREHSLAVDLRAAGEVKAVSDYAAVVLGGALYTGRWHPDARRFLNRHSRALAARPVAVFAMGPHTLEPNEVESSRHQLDEALARVPELAPFAVAIFGGVVDPTRLHFPFNRMPASDARDWHAIREWTEQLAARLARPPAPTVAAEHP